MICPSTTPRAAERRASDYNWPRLLDLGFEVKRFQDVWTLRKGEHEFTVNLPMGELWYKADYQHSRESLLLEEFVYFDGPHLELLADRIVGALDRAKRETLEILGEGSR